MIKKFLLLVCIILLGGTPTLWAQDEVTVTGLVTDAKKTPLPGVSISVSNVPGTGVITDKDGKFTIKVLQYHTLVFSSLGYEKQEILLKDQRELNVTMVEAKVSALDEVVVTATGLQRKISVTGAITTVNVEDLKSNPSTSMADALAGNVPTFSLPRSMNLFNSQ